MSSCSELNCPRLATKSVEQGEELSDRLEAGRLPGSCVNRPCPELWMPLGIWWAGRGEGPQRGRVKEGESERGDRYGLMVQIHTL